MTITTATTLAVLIWLAVAGMARATTRRAR